MYQLFLKLNYLIEIQEWERVEDDEVPYLIECLLTIVHKHLDH